jgi:hypothetical protein
MKNLRWIPFSILAGISVYMAALSPTAANQQNFMLRICQVTDQNGTVVQVGNTCNPGGSNCIENKCEGGPQT